MGFKRISDDLNGSRPSTGSELVDSFNGNFDSIQNYISMKVNNNLLFNGECFTNTSYWVGALGFVASLTADGYIRGSFSGDGNSSAYLKNDTILPVFNLDKQYRARLKVRASRGLLLTLGIIQDSAKTKVFSQAISVKKEFVVFDVVFYPLVYDRSWQDSIHIRVEGHMDTVWLASDWIEIAWVSLEEYPKSNLISELRISDFSELDILRNPDRDTCSYRLINGLFNGKLDVFASGSNVIQQITGLFMLGNGNILDQTYTDRETVIYRSYSAGVWSDWRYLFDGTSYSDVLKVSDTRVTAGINNNTLLAGSGGRIIVGSGNSLSNGTGITKVVGINNSIGKQGAVVIGDNNNIMHSFCTVMGSGISTEFDNSVCERVGSFVKHRTVISKLDVVENTNDRSYVIKIPSATPVQRVSVSGYFGYTIAPGGTDRPSQERLIVDAIAILVPTDGQSYMVCNRSCSGGHTSNIGVSNGGEYVSIIVTGAAREDVLTDLDVFLEIEYIK